VTSVPNLFIIGAMKAGTSSLHEYLGQHPEIFMCDPKEPCGLVAADQLETYWPEMAARGYCANRDAYLKLFHDAGDAKVIGESSTPYSKLPRIDGVAPRIAALNPEARIIYIMRDPIRRTISHYWHRVRQDGERRSMMQALQQEPHYLDVSHYAMQLRAYIDLFGRERVATLTLEKLVSQPAACVQSLFDWLGVDATFVPGNLEQRENVTPQAVEQVRGLGVMQRLRYSGLWDRVGPQIPPAIRRFGRRLAVAPIDRSEVSDDTAIEWLRPRQREQTAELCELLGRQFPEWSTLDGETIPGFAARNTPRSERQST